MRYVFADCEIDTQRRTVHRGGTEATLRPKPFQILLYLIDHRDRVVPKQELAEQLWPDQYPSDAVIENGILAARRAIGDSGRDQHVIQTLYGHGYRFVAAVTAVTKETDLNSEMDILPGTKSPPAKATTPPLEHEQGPTVPGQSKTLTASPQRAASRHQLTILYCDLAGTPVLSSQVDPEDYVDIIRTCQAACAAIIERFDGYIAYANDNGVLVYFGYPATHEDASLRAVHTGLEILDTFEQLSDHLLATYGVRVTGQIGIHTGLVVLAELGMGHHPTTQALGETSHLATRLHECAAPATLVMSEAVYQIVRGAFDCEELGAQILRGFVEPINVYQVRQVRSGISRFAARVRSRLTPLVGREHELALLLERWTQTRQGSGQVIFISGEAGIGKSRLAHALKDQITQEGYTTLDCQSSPYHQQTAFWPLIHVLHQLFEWQPCDSSEVKCNKMLRALEAAQLPVDETAALLTNQLALPVAEGEVPPLLPEMAQHRQKTVEALLTLVLGRGDKAPTLFMIEDWHWLDHSTREFLERLVNQAPTTRLLTVVTTRPTEPTPWAMRSYVATVSLGPLGPDRAAEMVDRVADSHDLPATTRQQIVTATDGVPLFIEEITKMVLETHPQRVPGANPEEITQIPTTLQDLLIARLDRRESAKRVIQLAATIGREFSYSWLQHLTSLEVTDLEHELNQLIQAELLYQSGLPPQATYLFKHALIQDAAYQSLLKPTRQQYHRRIAQMFVDTFPEIAATQPEFVGHHAVQGELWDTALQSYQQAGHHALSRSAYTEAVTCLDHALKALQYLPQDQNWLEQAVDLRWAMRSALIPLGDFERGMTLLQEAEQLATQLNDPKRLGRVVAAMAQNFAVHAFNYDRALACCQRALALAKTNRDTQLQSRVQSYEGMVLYYLGHYRQATDALHLACTSLEIEQRYALNGPLLLSVHSRTWLAHNLLELGEFSQGVQYAEEAVQISKTAEHLGSRIWAQYGLGLVELQKGDFARAIRRFDEALAQCGDAKIKLWVPGLTVNLGYAHVYSGHIELGLSLIERIVSPTHQASRPHSLLGEAYLLSGRLEDARQAAERALDRSCQYNRRGEQAWALRLLGEIASHQASPVIKQAQVHFDEALSLAEALGMRPLQAHCHRALGLMYHQMGQSERARAELSKACVMYQDMEMAFWLPETETALAEVDQQSGT